MEDFYTWMHKQNATDTNAVAMDARKLPPGVTLADHRKVCKAKPGHCPYEERNAKSEEADALTEPPASGESSQVQTSAAASVPTQDELLDVYQAEGVSPRLGRMVKDFHKAVLAGTAKPKRMPADAFKKDGGETPMWLLGAYYVASNDPDGDTASKALVDFAKKAGCFIPDVLGHCFDNWGDAIGEGMESTVYDAGDGKHVMKASELSLGSEGDLQKIERLILGNRYFPETAYTPKGIGQNPVGGLSFLLEQPKVQFDNSDPLTEDEVDEWLKTRGFVMRDSFLHNASSEGGDLACMDAHNENVVRTNDGNIVCLDPCVIPNVYDLGMHGFYDYDNPPEHFE